MKKNKLTLLIASSFLALAALAGCGGSKDEQSNASQSQGGEQSSQVS